MNRKKVVYILLLCVFFSGCNGPTSQPETVGQAVADISENDLKLNTAKIFLNTFFSFNSNDRFSSMDASVRRELDQYYAVFADLVTQSCMVEMKRLRIPYSYDEWYVTNYDSVVIKEITLSVYEDNVFDYVIKLELTDENEVIETEFHGQVGIEANGLVNSIYVAQNYDI